MTQAPRYLVGELVKAHLLGGQHVAGADRAGDAGSLAQGVSRKKIRDCSELSVDVIDLARHEEKRQLFHGHCPSIRTPRHQCRPVARPGQGSRRGQAGIASVRQAASLRKRRMLTAARRNRPAQHLADH